MKIVQLGCNDGNDDVYNIISSVNVEFALLVDANPHVLELARDKYKNIPNVHLVCFLVSNESAIKRFYIPHFSKNKFSGHSSIYFDHLLKHNHDKNDIKEFIINSISINELLIRYNLYNFDNLYVDCEGEDFNIINSIDLNILNIKCITFENKHMSIAEFNILDDKLLEAGYMLTKTGELNTSFNKLAN